jgi:predicted RNase H-like HicB family nuclease
MSQLADYKVVLYRQPDGSWAAYVPAIPGCHAIMPTREEVLMELENVFDMIREEFEAEEKALPRDVELTHA